MLQGHPVAAVHVALEVFGGPGVGLFVVSHFWLLRCCLRMYI